MLWPWPLDLQQGFFNTTSRGMGDGIFTTPATDGFGTLVSLYRVCHIRVREDQGDEMIWGTRVL